jgi:hypothetical protein
MYIYTYIYIYVHIYSKISFRFVSRTFLTKFRQKERNMTVAKRNFLEISFRDETEKCYFGETIAGKEICCAISRVDNLWVAVYTSQWLEFAVVIRKVTIAASLYILLLQES